VVWPIGPTAARVMLARFADAQLGGASPIASAAGDSLLLARFPVWFRAAVMHLVGEGGLPANDLEYAREKRAQLMPLRELLTLVRPVAQDSLLDPSRRGDADDLTRLIGAQSSTFARYLVEREGPPVLGRLARGYLAGRSLNEMIDEFTVAPHSIEELEQRWKYWLATRED